MTADDYLAEVESILSSIDNRDYSEEDIDSLNLSAIAHGVAGLLKLGIAPRGSTKVRSNITYLEPVKG